MNIYNINTIINPDKHILDPDYQYPEYDSDYNLYHYFKQIKIPQTVIYVVGIYLQIEIGDIIYENDQRPYQKISHRIQETINKYLDFGNAHLLNMNSNIFFLTMFDVLEDNLVMACIELNKYLSQKTIEKQPVHMSIGIYFSKPNISPYKFYQMSKEQFKNSIDHDGTFISVKYLSLFR